MDNPLITKLSRGNHLSARDKDTIAHLTSQSVRVAADQDIVSQGDRPRCVNVILSGLACRYKILRNDERSIMAYLLPGDICDQHVTILGRMDHSIGALTDCEVAKLPSSVIDKLASKDPNIARALWWSVLRDEAIMREWLVCMGRRTATKRVAHLFCELWHRYAAAGFDPGERFCFPVTQEELADTVGLSAIHVNRTLRTLRTQKLALVSGKSVTIPDLRRLELFAGFDRTYLHHFDPRDETAIEKHTLPASPSSEGEQA